MSSGRIVSVDTMTLVWGIRQDGAADLTKRARWLFQELENEEAQIVVSAVSLSEYLVPVEPAKRSAVAQRMSDRFIVAPFDIPSSILAARLFVEEKKRRSGGSPNSRKVLRADCLIVATAAAHGATAFYSHDKGCRALANRIIEAYELPSQPGNLFEY